MLITTHITTYSQNKFKNESVILTLNKDLKPNSISLTKLRIFHQLIKLQSLYNLVDSTWLQVAPIILTDTSIKHDCLALKEPPVNDHSPSSFLQTKEDKAWRSEKDYPILRAFSYLHLSTTSIITKRNISNNSTQKEQVQYRMNQFTTYSKWTGSLILTTRWFLKIRM